MPLTNGQITKKYKCSEMKVNEKLIKDLQKLAKLNFNKEESDSIKKDLEKMIRLIDKLNEIDMKDIDPLIYMSEERNILRDDIDQENLSQEEALKNAPDKDSDYFKVPTVLKK